MEEQTDSFYGRGNFGATYQTLKVVKNLFIEKNSKKKKKNSKKRLTRKVVCVKICRLSVETALKLEKRIDKQARKNTQVNF